VNSVWRPLLPVVEDSPLALCDAASVRNEDLLECDKVHADHIGEGLYLRYHQEQRWYWLSEQTNNEALVFVTWDSVQHEKRPGKLRALEMPSHLLMYSVGPPHVAFDNILAPPNAASRESIEVRLIVMTEK
jgi:hypothetical protein